MYVYFMWVQKKTNDFVAKYLQVNTLLLIINQFYDIFDVKQREFIFK